MKLLLMQILKYFTEINNIFWQHQCIVKIKIVNWYKTHFTGTLEKIINYFPGIFFSVSEGALLKKLIFFWQNALLFFFNIHETIS